MPEGPARPNHELWDRARRPPVLPHPPVRQRVGTELRRPPEATQVAGGAVACVRAVGPSEAHTTRSRERHHAPAARSSQWSRTTRGSSLHPRRQTEHTCERTRAGRAYEGRGETTGRRVRCFSTRAPRLTLTRACRAWRVEHGASGRRRLACPGYVSKLAPQEENQRTNSWPPWPPWPPLN